MQNHRVSPRWQVNLPAKIKLAKAACEADCQVKDINFKGLQIALNIKLDLDKYIKFRLILSKEFSLDVEAWVVWHKRIEERNVYGLYFNKLKDKDKETIYKFVYKAFQKRSRKAREMIRLKKKEVKRWKTTGYFKDLT